MIVVFTGNGKGKTTAALGQAVRLVGRGKRVLMIQFIKGPWKSGEDFIEIKNQKSKIKNTEGYFELRKRGLGFVGILGDKLPREEHANAAQRALHEFVAERASGRWDAFILDEVSVAVSLGLLTADEVLEAVKGLPAETIVVFTGRDAPEVFIEHADLVTEMRDIKHPFHEGKLAKISFDF